MVKNLPWNPGEVSSIPGQRIKITHVMGQLSPSAANTEACMQQLESPWATTKDSTWYNKDLCAITKTVEGRKEYTHRTILTELVSEWWNQEKEIFNMPSTHFTSRLEKNNIWRLRADLQNTRATSSTANTTLSGERLNSFPCNWEQAKKPLSLFYSAQYWTFYLVKLVCRCCCFLK